MLDLLQAWRKRYQVPRWVRLGGPEHNAVDLDGLMALHELGEPVRVGLESVCETFFDEPSPVVGDDGPLMAEGVTHIRLGHAPALKDAAPTPAAPSKTPTADKGGLELRPLRKAHVFPPGSPWLYLKLYYGSGLGSDDATSKFLADDLLGRLIAPLVSELEKAGLISGFHLVRYKDPEAHLRLRLLPCKGTALELLEHLRQRLDGEAERGAFATWMVATYEREVDRYGGPELIPWAERLFTADSRLCLRLLHASHRDKLEDHELQMLLPIRTLHTLYQCFGYDRSARKDLFLRFRRSHEQSRPRISEAKDALSDKYRKNSQVLQDILLWMEGQPDAGAIPSIRRKDIAAWYNTYARSVSEIATVYRDAEQRGALCRSIPQILMSIFHMHCNRLLGSVDREYEIVYLGQRAVESVCARMKKQS
jgi:thiopeptide-type bacteriocin biosynthesis protein